jgi:hypothetical protein
LLFDIKTNAGNYQQVSTFASNAKISSEEIVFIETKDPSKKYTYTGKTCGNSVTNIPNCPQNTPVAFVATDTGRTYVLVLDNSIGGKYLPVKYIYDFEGNKLSENEIIDKEY